MPKVVGKFHFCLKMFLELFAKRDELEMSERTKIIDRVIDHKKEKILTFVQSGNFYKTMPAKSGNFYEIIPAKSGKNIESL